MTPVRSVHHKEHELNILAGHTLYKTPLLSKREALRRANYQHTAIGTLKYFYENNQT